MAEALDAVPADVVVDYTHAAVVKQNVLAALERRVSVVIGSSGLGAADYDELDLLAAANGVARRGRRQLLAVGGAAPPVRNRGRRAASARGR